MNPMQGVGQSATFSVPGVRRVIYYDIYDEEQYTGTSGTVKYYTSVAGKGAHQTNLNQPGMLPFREEFDCIAISVIPYFGTPVADLNLFYNGVALEFEINTKPVLKAPVCIFTTGCGLEGLSGFTGTAVAAGEAAQAHNGEADPGKILTFPEPYHIGKGEQFGLKLITDTAITLSASFYCKVVMHGVIRSLVQ